MNIRRHADGRYYAQYGRYVAALLTPRASRACRHYYAAITRHAY